MMYKKKKEGKRGKLPLTFLILQRSFISYGIHNMCMIHDGDFTLSLDYIKIT